MGILDDLRLDIGDSSTPSSGVVAMVSSLIGDLRTDIGDTSGAAASGVAMISSLVDNLRTDIGDDSSASGVVSVAGSQQSIVDEIRVDTGDDSPLVDVQCPVVWCAKIVTEKVYNKTPTDVILFVNPTLPGPTTINLNTNPPIGTLCIIKDMKGDANVNPIIIQPPAGVKIDGFNRFMITQRKQSFMITWNGTEYNII